MTIIKTPCDEAVIRSGPYDLSRAAGGSWILVTTILGSSMAFIDGTVVNVALPALQSVLHATVRDVQWVMESYALLLSSLLLLGGALGDLYGRAKVFALGTILFALCSVWCGLAPSISSLIIARGVQGVGAALLVPGSLALLSASFPEAERGRAIGIWSGFTSITSAIGPVLGGWIVQHFSWRWAFFINVPIAVLVVCLTFWCVPESRNEEAPKKLDWPGAILATLGLGGITFALIEASRGGLAVNIAGLAGVAALVGFLIVEARSRWPMVPLALFRSRHFTAANLITFFLYAALGGSLFFFPLELIQVEHYSPTQAGAALLPFILLMFVLSHWSGGLIARFGPKLPLTVGPLISALGFGLLLRTEGPFWTTVFPAVIVLGVGMAVSVAPLTTTVMNSVPESEAGVASGINNAVSRVAGLLAVAVLGLILYAMFNRDLTHRLQPLSLSQVERQQVDQQRSQLAAAETSDPRVQRAIAESFLAGYHAILWTGVGLAAASGLCAWLFMDQKKISG